MIYTPQTKSAMKLCFDAHKDQVDKSGLPYVFHPLHLAEQMDTEDEVCVALLHDVMEDTSLTANDIRAAGMPEQVIEALLLMKHSSSDEYLDYVAKLAVNPLARKVKRTDLLHNSDLTRLDKVTDADRDRVRKYKRALELLDGNIARGSLPKNKQCCKNTERH